IAAAQSQRTSFPDGCFFVSLANITDPALVLSTIAQTFDVSEVPSQPLRASLQSFLREKVVLLVLDNFEQVLGAGILVGELLEAAPRLTVLVTSRAPLRLRGEHEYVVRPLAVPAKPAADRTEMLHYAAVRLFLERAQAVKTDFQFDDETAAAVAEITARLDGLPLAIELAAARVKILQPQALLKRLGKSLALLTGGAHDFPSRHQTLRATIDWSYNLLEPEEKLLFARLAVFVGSWSLDAAEAVCNAPGDLAVGLLDGIQSLVNKSMLQQVDGEPGEPRFTMLETIHEYAAERLVDCDDIHDIQLQHALYFLKLAEEAEPQLTGMAQQVQLNRLDAEYENFRAALRWLVD
ncbi:MAG: transcriptional regulator, partial [Chloroflexi bacterium]